MTSYNEDLCNFENLDLLQNELKDDYDWVVACEERPSKLLSEREINQWLKGVQNHPQIEQGKYLLLTAVDIIRSRNGRSSSPVALSPYRPLHTSKSGSRDLLDIQMLARMQEDNLRESTLQRTKRRSATKHQNVSDMCYSNITGYGNDDSFTPVNGHEPNSFAVSNGMHEEQLPQYGHFRARNYDQSTFRVKKKSTDNIKRPVIEPASNVRNFVEDEEFELDEKSAMLSVDAAEFSSSSLHSIAAQNSRMISEAKKGEGGAVFRSQSDGKPLNRSTDGDHQQQRRLSRAAAAVVSTHNLTYNPSGRLQSANDLASDTSRVTMGSTTQIGGASGQRNKSIPRSRTGIPVMATAAASNASNGSSHQQPPHRGAQRNLYGNAAKSVSPRRRNSSGSVLTAATMKKFPAAASNNSMSNLKTSSRTTGSSTAVASKSLNIPKPQSSRISTSSSSSNLKNVRSRDRLDFVRPNTTAGASSTATSFNAVPVDYGYDDEFY